MVLVPEPSGTLGASWAWKPFYVPCFFLSFFEFAFLVIFIGVLLLYSAVLVSAIKQSESVSCVYMYIFISCIYHKYAWDCTGVSCIYIYIYARVYTFVCMHHLCFEFPSHSGHHRAWVAPPALCGGISLVVYFIHSSACTSISASHFTHPLPPRYSYIHSLSLCLFLLCK